MKLTNFIIFTLKIISTTQLYKYFLLPLALGVLIVFPFTTNTLAPYYSYINSYKYKWVFINTRDLLN